LAAALPVVRQASPHLVEAVIGPTVCFLLGRVLWGFSGAIGLVLVWDGASLARRRLRGMPVSALVCIGAATTLLRAAASLATNCANLFFVAPSVITAVTGTIYMTSALTATPLVASIVKDLLPRSLVDTADPRVIRLCRAGSLLWGAEQILAAAASVWLVLNLSTTAYVTLHVLMSWVMGAAVIAIAVPFFWDDFRALSPPPARRT
jgi:hypothetical protein